MEDFTLGMLVHESLFASTFCPVVPYYFPYYVRYMLNNIVKVSFINVALIVVSQFTLNVCNHLPICIPSLSPISTQVTIYNIFAKTWNTCSSCYGYTLWRCIKVVKKQISIQFEAACSKNRNNFLKKLK